tara:strand:+ start:23928 stop:25208 length:1281 start_codon:yes stop_codon:yes gene_type:complete
MVRPLIEITGAGQLPLVAVGAPAAPSLVASSLFTGWESMVFGGPSFDFGNAAEDVGLLAFLTAASTAQAVELTFTDGVPSAGSSQSVSSGISNAGSTTGQKPCVRGVPGVDNSYLITIHQREHPSGSLKFKIKEVSVSGGTISNPSFATSGSLGSASNNPYSHMLARYDASDPSYWHYAFAQVDSAALLGGMIERTGVNTFSFALTGALEDEAIYDGKYVMPYYDELAQKALLFSAGSGVSSMSWHSAVLTGTGWSEDSAADVFGAGARSPNQTVKLDDSLYLSFCGGNRSTSAEVHARVLTPSMLGWQSAFSFPPEESIFKLIGVEEVDPGIYLARLIEANQLKLTTTATVRVRSVTFRLDTTGGSDFAERVGDWVEVETVDRTGDAGANPFEIILPQLGAHDTAVLLYTGADGASIRMSHFSVA